MKHIQRNRLHIYSLSFLRRIRYHINQKLHTFIHLHSGKFRLHILEHRYYLYVGNLFDRSNIGLLQRQYMLGIHWNMQYK